MAEVVHRRLDGGAGAHGRVLARFTAREFQPTDTARQLVKRVLAVANRNVDVAHRALDSLQGRLMLLLLQRRRRTLVVAVVGITTVRTALQAGNSGFNLVEARFRHLHNLAQAQLVGSLLRAQVLDRH
jgi:hypothetical protein